MREVLLLKKHSEKVQIKAAKRWNGGSISSFANTELYLLTRRTVTEFSAWTTSTEGVTDNKKPGTLRRPGLLSN